MTSRKKNNVALFIVCVLCFPWPSRADNNGGSSYSRYGLGDIRYFSSSRSMGMGGASIGVLSTNTIDRMNPAAWTQINRTRFSASALYEGFSSTDFSGSVYLSRTRFNGITLAVPIAKDHGITFGAGVAPYSRVNYNMLSPITQGNLSYTLQYLGDGGLSQAHAGFSGLIGGDLHLGAKFNYYFGSINHSTSQTFSTTDYTSSQVTRATEFNGAGMTLGAIYSGLKNLVNLGEGNALNLAATFTTTSYLTISEERYNTYNTGTVTTRDTITFPDGKLRLPYSFIVGAAYQSDKVTVASDFAYQHWSDFTVNGATSSDLRDSYRFGAGIELLPKKDLSAPFTQRLVYRLGLFYNASYYKIKNQEINEFGVSGGLGIPLFSDTRLNVAGEYIFRGTTDFQLQKDKILRISFTLDIGELWFVQPPEE